MDLITQLPVIKKKNDAIVVFVEANKNVSPRTN